MPEFFVLTVLVWLLSDLLP